MHDHKIPGQKLYRLSPAEDKELQEQLSSLEKLGFVEPSVSLFWVGSALCAEAKWEVSTMCGLSTFECQRLRRSEFYQRAFVARLLCHPLQ